MQSVNLEDTIRQYITLDPAGHNGWQAVLCKVCNDAGRKGKRAGFRFDLGGVVGYHCFNCGHKAKYDPSSSKNLSRAMKQVLTSFSVPEEVIQQINFEALKLRDLHLVNGETIPNPIQDIEPAAISLPSHFYPLTSAGPNDIWAQLASAYLELDRGVDPKSYPFMLAEKTGDPELDRWFKRIIIPIYKDETPIFFIGRDLTGKNIKKYLSPSFSKEKVIYGYSELLRETDEPLYIVEGWFDAFAINGVAVLGNEISKAQTAWLNRSHRKKVYIPDRFGDGQMAAQQALDLGWSIATPGINTWTKDIKDMNDAVKKYGRMFVMKSIAETIADGFTARVNLGMYCKNGTSNKNRSKKENKETSSPKRTRS